MVRFLDPETAEILQLLDPEIVKMDKKIYGSRNPRNGAISGSRNPRKGRQILYRIFDCRIFTFKSQPIWIQFYNVPPFICIERLVYRKANIIPHKGIIYGRVLYTHSWQDPGLMGLKVASVPKCC